MRSWHAAVVVGLVGCSNIEGDSGGLGAGYTTPATGATTGIATGTVTGSTTDCEPVGTVDCPIRISAFPYVDSRNTADAPGSELDGYSCAPYTDESGPEWVYQAVIPERGILSVSVDDVNGDAVDIDVHILGDVLPDSCLNRDNIATGWVVEAGTAIVVADTYVNSLGDVMSGEYTLSVDFFPLDSGPCAAVPTDVRMFWSECGPGIDCDVYQHTDGADYPFVHTPSVGALVKEAHLVTTDEDFGGGWPTSFTDQIDRHYQVTEAASGYAMSRTEPWAPSGEGGSSYGQGATGVPVPPEHETWYVNMYWRDRPDKGHRMILINPITGAAAVAAAGYETGPGSNESIGGASEEIHDVLGTIHHSPVVMSFPADQSLPYGPIDCF